MHDETWQWHTQSGRLLTLRLIAPEDRARYAAYVEGLSYGTRYFRYGHGNLRLTDAELDLVCRIDPTEGRRYVVVTTENGEDVIVATGGYFRHADGESCDMTIVVADAWHGTQIAHRLMKTLIQRAAADRLKCMVAHVLATNRKMLRFTQRHGFGLLPGQRQEAIKALCLRLDGGGCQCQTLCVDA
ncbi:MAG: GNAT family N-acetyltransferase [Rhodocyclaceae bacterium]|nr:GNAT family N-acetyltransferase [Rhodocyclaceae bacterium]MDZ4213267.1 GNAT family N-acetyltransferase [Rhodocyclaceae bacterium]